MTQDGRQETRWQVPCRYQGRFNSFSAKATASWFSLRQVAAVLREPSQPNVAHMVTPDNESPLSRRSHHHA
jgi:hypothetical protein